MHFSKKQVSSDLYFLKENTMEIVFIDKCKASKKNWISHFFSYSYQEFRHIFYSHFDISAVFYLQFKLIIPVSDILSQPNCFLIFLVFVTAENLPLVFQTHCRDKILAIETQDASTSAISTYYQQYQPFLITW